MLSGFFFELIENTVVGKMFDFVVQLTYVSFPNFYDSGIITCDFIFEESV